MGTIGRDSSAFEDASIVGNQHRNHGVSMYGRRPTLSRMALDSRSSSVYTASIMRIQATNAFRASFSPSDLAILQRLRSPIKIQEFLWDLPYSADEFYRSPRSVLRDRKAHCFDGALFAAAALRRIGFPPLLVDLIPNERDDDHVIALFKIGGRWGAVAKSNFAGLTYREAIHRTIREVVLSYFEHFYNVAKEKTLRAYTVPVNLTRFDKIHWMGNDDQLQCVADGLDRARKVRLLTPSMVRYLAPVDERSFRAGLMGSNPEGLFKL
jgi:hypothetical protein